MPWARGAPHDPKIRRAGRAHGAGDAAAVADLINVVFQAGGAPTGYVAAEIEDVVTTRSRIRR
ncbi:MAG TPA: hypothetical protein VJT31_31505 [Rugosimonospora sp.]|nr:hypothetical protein [Rugosimonospora sp.]